MLPSASDGSVHSSGRILVNWAKAKTERLPSSVQSARAPCLRTPQTLHSPVCLHALRVSPVRLDVRSLPSLQLRASKPHPLIQKTDSSIFFLFLFVFIKVFPNFSTTLCASRRIRDSLLQSRSAPTTAPAWTQCAQCARHSKFGNRDVQNALLWILLGRSFVSLNFDGYLNSEFGFGELQNKVSKKLTFQDLLPDLFLGLFLDLFLDQYFKWLARTGREVTMWNDHKTSQGKLNLRGRFCLTR